MKNIMEFYSHTIVVVYDVMCTEILSKKEFLFTQAPKNLLGKQKNEKIVYKEKNFMLESFLMI